jgi:hypothetical protein
MILHGLSRAPHNPPEPVAPEVVARILEIRECPPKKLKRIPGPQTILYYLHQEEELKQHFRLPTSTRTIWKILDQHGCIYRPPPCKHELMERPEPMLWWAIDFKDIASVPPEPGGKQQHVVEWFNVIDTGTSVLLDATVRGDFNSANVIRAIVDTFLKYGRPRLITFDRDSRFVGSWRGQDFPTPFVRFLLCLDIKPDICPPQRPDKNPFIERYHGNYKRECLAVHQPKTLEEAREVTQAYKQHYNWERPSQALSCGNQPPRVAFPTLPARPPLPKQIDPDSWLKAVDRRRYTRRINSQGSIRVDGQSYYVTIFLRK